MVGDDGSESPWSINEMIPLTRLVVHDISCRLLICSRNKNVAICNDMWCMYACACLCLNLNHMRSNIYNLASRWIRFWFKNQIMHSEVSSYPRNMFSPLRGYIMKDVPIIHHDWTWWSLTRHIWTLFGHGRLASMNEPPPIPPWIASESPSNNGGSLPTAVLTRNKFAIHKPFFTITEPWFNHW